MSNLSYIPQVVPFHDAELMIIEHHGQPYTPMKPIVEAMGLDWKSQFVKLKDRSVQLWWKSPQLPMMGKVA